MKCFSGTEPMWGTGDAACPEGGDHAGARKQRGRREQHDRGARGHQKEEYAREYESLDRRHEWIVSVAVDRARNGAAAKRAAANTGFK
jgi:hypothetical protein